MKTLLFSFVFIFAYLISVGQTTEIVILSKNKINNLNELVKQNQKAKCICGSFTALAENHIKVKSQTIREIVYNKERTALGITKYQPGTLFNPKDAVSLFEWAGFYNPDWYSLFGHSIMENNYLASGAVIKQPLI